MIQKILLYSDGGARGNPGPAASAFIATSPSGEILKSDAQFVGKRTNNQAEYEALLMALRYAVEQKAQEVTCYLDSELVAKQLNGQYQVKNAELQLLNRQAKTLLANFKKANFINVPRENPQICKADALVNQTLDRQTLCPTKTQSTLSGVFVHACIRTSNLQRSVDFYQRFFGLTVTAKCEYKAQNADLVFMRDPQGKGCLLELMFCRTQRDFVQPPKEKRLFDHLAFEVPDIYALIDELKRSGVKIVEAPEKFDEATVIALVKDPDGVVVELIERR